MATETNNDVAQTLARVFPLGSRLNERGRLEVGGCDTIELAREFGTPAYVVAEDALRATARAFLEGARKAGHADLHVVFASKAFPCTAVLRTFAQEGLWCDVASGGELHLALNAGFPPERLVLHGNAKSEAELRLALRHRVGLIVIDNLDEIDRLEALVSDGGRSELGDGEPGEGWSGNRGLGEGGSGDRGLGDRGPADGGLGHGEPGDGDLDFTRRPQPVLVRVTPNVKGDTHEKISTGQADSKFGFAMDQVGAAIERLRGIPGLALEGVHAHIGSQLFDLEPFRREVAQLAALEERLVGPGGFPTWDLGGGLGVAYTVDQHPPAIDDYVSALVTAARAGSSGGDSGGRSSGGDSRGRSNGGDSGGGSSGGDSGGGGYDHPGRRLLIEPGRALTANTAVTLYTVESVKRNVSTWVAVDGGMSDNLRPMLYGALYEAHVADRFGGLTPCVLAGKHCESGDVLVRDARLDDPRPGDVIVTPATGAYGYAMCNTYNGVPRPPVIFCKDGNARVVVRRETFEELTARDVP